MRYYAFHKPAGVVTTMRDPQGREDLRGYLPGRRPPGLPRRPSRPGHRGAAGAHERRRAREPADASELRRGEGVPGRGRGHPDRPAAQTASAGASTSRTDRRTRSPLACVAASGDRGAVRLVMAEGRKREVRRLLAAVGPAGHAPRPPADRPGRAGDAGAGRPCASSSPTRCAGSPRPRAPDPACSLRRRGGGPRSRRCRR